MKETTMKETIMTEKFTPSILGIETEVIIIQDADERVCIITGILPHQRLTEDVIRVTTALTVTSTGQQSVESTRLVREESILARAKSSSLTFPTVD